MGRFEVLRAYFESKGAISGQEFDFMKSVFLPRTFAVGEYLQRAGEPASHAAFVTAGCLRSYVIDAKGKEHVVQFAPETWWLSDTTSLSTGAPSQFFIDAVEDSEVLLIDPPGHLALLARVPVYAASFQEGIQKPAASKDRRIVNALATTAEQRYLGFLGTYPSIASRVPQWMLASYLGLTPETLSRVRRNLSKHKSAPRS